MLVFDVKVYEEDTDFKGLWEKIMALQFEGLVWNRDFNLVEIAYGMKKLRIGCVVEDDKIAQDDIFDKI
jgi:elongation factor 1-beta